MGVSTLTVHQYCFLFRSHLKHLVPGSGVKRFKWSLVCVSVQVWLCRGLRMMSQHVLKQLCESPWSTCRFPGHAQLFIRPVSWWLIVSTVRNKMIPQFPWDYFYASHSVFALSELGTAKTFHCDESQGSNCVANIHSQTHSRTVNISIDKQHKCNIKVQTSSINIGL